MSISSKYIHAITIDDIIIDIIALSKILSSILIKRYNINEKYEIVVTLIEYNITL